MKAITLRNIPPQLARVLEREAKASSTSLNRTVIRILQRAAGLGNEQPSRSKYTDLDDLAGSWSPEAAQAFEKDLAVQRQIDPELWN